VALNRLQLRYATKPLTVTIGRQRIVLDDQRFVGNGPWRQTEQTFDAARVQTAWGPLQLEATHAIRQNTVNGGDGAPRAHLRGDFTFVNGGIATKRATLKGFAYLLDYDAAPFLNQPGARAQLDSSQTYGLRANGSLPLGHGASLALAGSVAWQSSYGRNPNAYAATYSSIEPALTLGQHTLTLTREVLGADARAQGGAWSFQTPLSSLHKFNGWADMFLTTPPMGCAIIRDSDGQAAQGQSPAPRDLYRGAPLVRRRSGRGALRQGNQRLAGVFDQADQLVAEICPV
jgi:hypothetical protein